MVAHYVLGEPLTDVNWSNQSEVQSILAHQRLKLLTCELLLPFDRLTPFPLALIFVIVFWIFWK